MLILYHMQPLFVEKGLPFADIRGMKAHADVGEVALLGLCDRLGRLGSDPEAEAEVQARFGSVSIRTGEIFPTNSAPVLLAENEKMIPKPMSRDFPSFKGKRVIINARGEMALDKPTFRRSLLERRCLVPTTGLL